VNKVYCYNCKKYVEYAIKKETIREYKGVIVNVEENIPYCPECQQELFVPEIENENLKRLYKRYKELTGIDVCRSKKASI